MNVPVDDAVVAQFSRLYAAGRLAHAYLFTGPLGIGKHETALAIARRLNCREENLDPAGCACASCRKIMAGNHPDIFVVEKPHDKAGIAIGQVRALMERFGFRALEARVKFALIRDAECINEEAANALLKTLEEPHSGTVLVLTTAVPAALPATVRSRCQVVRFSAMSNSALAQLLKSRYDMPSDDAQALAAFGQGSPGRALDLGGDFMGRRRAVLDAFLGQGGTEDFIKAAGASRDSAREALAVVLMACRDALFIRIGAPQVIVNGDRQVEIRRFAQRYTPQELDAQARRTAEAIGRIDGNQNIKVVLTLVREML